MRKDHAAKRDGKAFGTNRVQESKRLYLDKAYDLILLSGNRMTLTGRLDTARLEGKCTGSSTIPEFLFRWHDKADALDVDPINVSDAEKRNFRKGTVGYRGHHTQKISSSPRTFEVDIECCGKKIYWGHIQVSLAREAEFSAAITIGEVVAKKLSKKEEANAS